MQIDGMERLELRYAVGYECNLACRHCYNRHLVNPASHPGSEATDPKRDTARLQKLMAVFALEGLVVTGGEPFFTPLRERTLALIAVALDDGLLVRVSTNGMFLTDSVCRRLQNMVYGGRNLLLQVSLDAAEPSVHDFIRGCFGAHEAAVKGVQTAIEKGLNVRVRCTISRHNVGEVVDCYDLCRRLGVSEFIGKPCIPFGPTENRWGHAPEPQAFAEVRSRLMKKARDGGPRLRLAHFYSFKNLLKVILAKECAFWLPLKEAS